MPAWYNDQDAVAKKIWYATWIEVFSIVAVSSASDEHRRMLQQYPFQRLFRLYRHDRLEYTGE